LAAIKRANRFLVLPSVAPFGNLLLWSCHIVLVLVDGAKVARWMKKRKNFFQVFSFSFILQGFHGEKIVAFFWEYGIFLLFTASTAWLKISAKCHILAKKPLSGRSLSGFFLL
jgi:hypothetical protein